MGLASTSLWRVIAPMEMWSPSSLTYLRSSRRLRSTRTAGAASLSFMIGRRLWPPARSLASSPCWPSRSIAWSTDWRPRSRRPGGSQPITSNRSVGARGSFARLRGARTLHRLRRPTREVGFALSCIAALGVLDRLPHLPRGGRHVYVRDAVGRERVRHRVYHRGRRPDGPGLPDTLDP